MSSKFRVNEEKLTGQRCESSNFRKLKLRKFGTRNSKLETTKMLRAIVTIFGIVLAAIGGVIAYRALFVEPSAAVLISERGIRQLPDTFRVVEGTVLLVVGTAIAFMAALRKPRR